MIKIPTVISFSRKQKSKIINAEKSSKAIISKHGFVAVWADSSLCENAQWAKARHSPFLNFLDKKAVVYFCYPK